MKYAIFLLIMACGLGFSSAVLAQVGTDLNKTNIDVSIIPENPKPNEQVRVSVVSYGTNVNSANITWKINGKTIKTGIGEKVFDFVAGDMNTTTTLDIVVTTREGEVINKTFNIKPSSVDLIWQAEAFAPPFYKGKVLFSHQDKITFIAIPHITSANGAEFGIKNLVYKWKKNGSVADSSSGYGKNTYTFTGSLISRPLNIEVEVSTADNSGTGYASSNVAPIEPFVLFYNKSPIYGIEFQKALQGTVGLDNSKELTVVGMPFFFGTKKPESPELNYKWAINGTPINNGNKTEQVFRQKEGTTGTSNISLSIENSAKILQYANSQFNLSFGK